MTDTAREMTPEELDAQPVDTIALDGDGVAWTRIQTANGYQGWHYFGPDSEFPDWPSAVLAANGPITILGQLATAA